MASHLGSTAPDSWEIEVWWIECRGEVRFKDILTSLFLLHEYIFTSLKLELCSSVQEYAWYYYMWIVDFLFHWQIGEKNLVLRQMYIYDLWSRNSFHWSLLTLMMARDIHICIWTLDFIFKRIQIESYT